MIALASRLTLHDVNLSIVQSTDNYLWFIQEFQRLLIASDSRGEPLLPNIKDSNDNIGVFSDYGGESPNSKYLTYSFLVCALDQKDIFIKKMKELRQQTGLDSPPKEIAFKDIHYGPIKRAIKAYLTNLDNYVNGYLLTVVIEKSIRTLFDKDKKSGHDFITKTLVESGLGAWKPDVAEKNIAHYPFHIIFNRPIIKARAKNFLDDRP